MASIIFREADGQPDKMATPQRSLMMEIEIKFGKGRSDRVKVHYDDDADLLAEVRYEYNSIPDLF